MPATPLANGYNVIINQKVSGTNTPVYPITRTKNVKDSEGNTLDAIITSLSASATTSSAGRVQLSNAVDSSSESTAATSLAVKTVQDAVTALSTSASNTYVAISQLGAATSNGTTGVATLDENGLVVTSQLPSYVDDVIDVAVTFDSETGAVTSVVDGNNAAVTGESGKIYVDVLGATPTNNTFRWSGTAFVEISKSLALGETATTAFDGLRGKAAYDHSIATHARIDATKVEGINFATEADTYNGYIKVWGREAESATYVKVYEPAALTSEDVVTALGYTPQNSATLATAANNGVMSAEYAAKLDNCLQTSVAQTAPTFSDGLWYQIVDVDSAE